MATDYFFSTSRAYDETSHKFTNDVANGVNYAFVRRVGNNKYQGSKLRQSDWITKLSSLAAGRDVLVYVHGFNTQQINAQNTLHSLSKHLSDSPFDGAVVGHSWPSLGRLFDIGFPSDGDLTSYSKDKKMVARIAERLVTGGLWPLMRAPGIGKVHLIAHSMGAYVVALGFQKLALNAGDWAQAGQLGEVVFASADTHQKWWEASHPAMRSISKRARRVTNYFCGRDLVLDASETNFNRKNGQPSLRAGRHGVVSDLLANLEDVSTNAYYRRRFPIGAGIVKSHRWYFTNPRFYRDLAPVLNGDAATDIAGRIVGQDGRSKLSKNG